MRRERAREERSLLKKKSNVDKARGDRRVRMQQSGTTVKESVAPMRLIPVGDEMRHKGNGCREREEENGAATVKTESESTQPKPRLFSCKHASRARDSSSGASAMRCVALRSTRAAGGEQRVARDQGGAPRSCGPGGMQSLATPLSLCLFLSASLCVVWNGSSSREAMWLL